MFRGKGGGLPLIDVWTDHVIRISTPAGGGATKSFAIAGYGLTVWPTERGAEETPREHGSSTYAFSWRYPAANITGYPPDGIYGRNKWFGLARELWDEVSDIVVTFFKDKEEDGVLDLGWTIEITGLRPNSYEGYAGESQYTACHHLGVRTIDPEAPGTRRFITDDDGTMVIVRPAGTWAPCSQAWSLEVGSLSTSTRTTASPYVPWEVSRRVWGTTRTSTLLASVIPAADIFAYKASDIGHKGWAEAAGREPSRSIYSTLESLYPWMMSSVPQREVLRVDGNSDPNWKFPMYETLPSQVWSIDKYGSPIILVLDLGVVGRSYPLGAMSRPSNDPNEILLWASNAASFRHMMLADSTSLEDMVSAVVLNRLYDVELPFLDITWPTQPLKDPELTHSYYEKPTLPGSRRH